MLLVHVKFTYHQLRLMLQWVMPFTLNAVSAYSRSGCMVVAFERPLN